MGRGGEGGLHKGTTNFSASNPPIPSLIPPPLTSLHSRCVRWARICTVNHRRRAKYRHSQRPLVGVRFSQSWHPAPSQQTAGCAAQPLGCRALPLSPPSLHPTLTILPELPKLTTQRRPDEGAYSSTLRNRDLRQHGGLLWPR